MLELDEGMVRGMDRDRKSLAVLAQIEIEAVGMKALENGHYVSL
jgi:hypothetical protein